MTEKNLIIFGQSGFMKYLGAIYMQYKSYRTSRTTGFQKSQDNYIIYIYIQTTGDLPVKQSFDLPSYLQLYSAYIHKTYRGNVEGQREKAKQWVQRATKHKG